MAAFWPAIIAFSLTGIGLPLLGVMVGALDKMDTLAHLIKFHLNFQ